MQRAGSPLEFIKKNLAAADPTFQPQQISDAVALQKVIDEDRETKEARGTTVETVSGAGERQDSNSISAKTNSGIEDSGEESFSYQFPEENGNKEDAAPNKESAETDELDVEETDPKVVPTLPEKYKRIKTVYKETKQSLKAIQEERDKLDRELKAYQTGEAIPEIIKEKEERIAALENYEHLHNLKMSKEYQTNFVEPLNEKGAKLAEYGRDYGLSEDVLNHALSLTNKVERNQFLSQYVDPVGGLEINNIITDMQSIHARAKEAEQKPKEVFSQLREENARITQQRDIERKNKIVNVTKRAWAQSLQKIKEEGKVTELIARDNDPEFNRNFPHKIAANAGAEFGKIIKALADSGVDNIPEDVAFAIANMCQLAHASASAVESRNAALDHAEEIKSSSRLYDRLTRPQLGKSGGGDAVPQRAANEKVPTAKEAAAGLMQSILSRKR